MFIWERNLFAIQLTVFFIVSAEAGYTDQDYKLFDPKTILAYNVIKLVAFSHDI